MINRLNNHSFKKVIMIFFRQIHNLDFFILRTALFFSQESLLLNQFMANVVNDKI